MIAYLRGTLRDIQNSAAVVDVGGVGYLAHLPPSLAESLAPQVGEEVELTIATIVREDAITLYGFSDGRQRELFDIILGVKGVGPRVGLAILGTLSAAQLAAAIQQDQAALLVKVPGVGKRLASRMCLELKDKIPAHFQAESTTAAAAGAPPRFVAPQDPLPLALAQLGYRKSEIDAVFASPDVPKLDEQPIEVRLSAALRVLQRQ